MKVITIRLTDQQRKTLQEAIILTNIENREDKSMNKHCVEVLMDWAEKCKKDSTGLNLLFG